MNRGRALTALFAAVLTLDASPPVSACVVSLRTPFWSAIDRAEWIVLARIEAIEKSAETEEGSGNGAADAVAAVSVLETWKGSRLRDARVDLSPRPFPGAPLSAGELVVMFLESGEASIRRTRGGDEPASIVSVSAPGTDTGSETEEESAAAPESRRQWEASRRGRLFPVWAPSSIFRLDEREVGSFRDLVSTAVSLQGSGGPSEANRREWLVSAASEPSARGIALKDLAAETETSGASAALAPSEAQRIARGFIRAPAADGLLPVLLRLLSGYEDAALDAAVVSVIEAGLAAPEVPRWIPEVIRQIVVRSGWRDWGAAIWERHRAAGTLTSLWPAVARDLGLPSTGPARVRLEGN